MICGGLSERDKELGKKALENLRKTQNFEFDFELSGTKFNFDSNFGLKAQLNKQVLKIPDPNQAKKIAELNKINQEKIEADNELNKLEKEMLLKMVNILVLAELVNIF